MEHVSDDEVDDDEESEDEEEAPSRFIGFDGVPSG